MHIPFFGRKARAPAPRAWPELLRTNWPNSELPRSYEALARDAYCRNPIAQRAVRIITESAAGAPVLSTPAGHPALALLSGGEPGPSLIETIAANLLLHGNAYVRVGLGAGGLPASLFTLRPERVTVEVDSSGWPTGYLYRTGETVTRYPAVTVGDQPGLLHIRSFHPLDDHYGLGCLGAASAAVDTHNAASRWNKALLDNAARPSGALVYAPGDGATLSPEQFDRLKLEMEQAFAGAINAGRPMLLEGGLSWQPLSMTPAEMDFGRARDTASREIALAFGVPPMLLGLAGDNSYPTAATDDTTRPFGTLQYVASGAAGAFAASNPQDKLIDLVHALRTPYRQGACFVMNSAVLARIRKMKDNYGGFIWQPALAADQPATLLGYPVYEADAMPDVGPDSLSIAFGNFKAGYLIAERSSTALLRDPFSSKPFVQFYATRRLGGAVINSEAIKLLKFSAA